MFFLVVLEGEAQYNTGSLSERWGVALFLQEVKGMTIREFNKHYRKAVDLLEDCSSSEKMEMAERVIDWLRDLPEEYVISLASLFNEVIDDLGDDSVEKILLRGKNRKREEEEEEEEEQEEDMEDFEEDEEEDEEDRDDY